MKDLNWETTCISKLTCRQSPSQVQPDFSNKARLICLLNWAQSISRLMLPSWCCGAAVPLVHQEHRSHVSSAAMRGRAYLVLASHQRLQIWYSLHTKTLAQLHTQCASKMKKMTLFNEQKKGVSGQSRKPIESLSSNWLNLKTWIAY